MYCMKYLAQPAECYYSFFFWLQVMALLSGFAGVYTEVNCVSDFGMIHFFPRTVLG